MPKRRALTGFRSRCRALLDSTCWPVPSITGKLESEYEGELKGGDAVARELIRLAVGKVFNTYFEGEKSQQRGPVV